MESLSVLSSITGALLLYVLSLGIYRIWFSPVAHIPGPLLAKLTYGYEFYWDFIKVGRYVFHIRKLHDKYGPIIRINPHEVHVDDPAFYDELNASAATGKKRNKSSFLVNSFGISEATFATIDHDKHRLRRAGLQQFFSKSKIRVLQERIEPVLQKLLHRMHQCKENRNSMSMGLAFTAVANDIASAYAFATDTFRIDAPDFAPDFHIAGYKGTTQGHFMKHFPWILTLVQALPVSWVVAMDPESGAYMELQRWTQEKTKEIQIARSMPDYKPPERTTIFHEILSSTDVPESEKQYDRLWQDGQVVLVAGTLTTAFTLSNIFFFLLSDAKKLKRLRDELCTAIPDDTTAIQLSVLESLPYLTACVMEALRVGNGVSTRLQRIDPDNAMVFHAKTKSYGAPAAEDTSYVLPPGTPVSMTSLLIHFNPRIYPDPYSYNPDRWLETDPVTGKSHIHHKLDKYFVPFSKGTRACIGLNLAWAELFLVTAIVFRRYGSREVQMPGDEGYMELFDSSYERDIEIVGDGIIPIVREPLKGITVKIYPCDGDEKA